MATFLPQRWRQCPRFPVRIDWGHPLSRGLLSAPLVGSNFDAVSGRSSAPDTMELYLSYFVAPATPLASEYTLVGAAGATAGDNSTPGYAQLLSEVYFTYKGFLTLYAEMLGGLYQAYAIDGSSAYIEAAGITSSNRTVAATFKGGGVVRFFSGGRLKGASVDVWDGSYDVGNLTSEVVTSRYMSSALCYERVLSDAEIAAIDENPYQILQPLRQTFYSFPSGAPAGPVLSSTTVTEIGATSARIRTTITYSS